MATKIPLPTKSLTSEQEQWLAKNVGPRMHYLHHSIGGQGWLVKREWLPGMTHQEWYLTLEDDKLATFFTIKFSS
jgi:hypothetical protein